MTELEAALRRELSGKLHTHVVPPPHYRGFFIEISPAGVTAGASVQATVLIPKGENSATFPVRVQNTKNAAAQNFQIVATVTLAGGTPASVGAILTITGFAPPSA